MRISHRTINSRCMKHVIRWVLVETKQISGLFCSSFSQLLYPAQRGGGLGVCPGVRPEHTLDTKSASECHTLTGNCLSSPRTDMCLGGGRKPENPEQTHMDERPSVELPNRDKGKLLRRTNCVYYTV